MKCRPKNMVKIPQPNKYNSVERQTVTTVDKIGFEKPGFVFGF